MFLALSLLCDFSRWCLRVIPARVWLGLPVFWRGRLVGSLWLPVSFR